MGVLMWLSHSFLKPDRTRQSPSIFTLIHMTGSTYSSPQVADDASEYAIACAILRDDPDDADAQATIDALDDQYGEGFFED